MNRNTFLTNKHDNFDESVVSQDELDKAMEEFNKSIMSNGNKVSFSSTQQLKNIHSKDMDQNTNSYTDAISNSVKKTD